MAQRMNVTQTFISKCERGERRLDVVELWEWCLALGVDVREFAGALHRALEESS